MRSSLTLAALGARPVSDGCAPFDARHLARRGQQPVEIVGPDAGQHRTLGHFPNATFGQRENSQATGMMTPAFPATDCGIGGHLFQRTAGDVDFDDEIRRRVAGQLNRLVVFERVVEVSDVETGIGFKPGLRFLVPVRRSSRIVEFDFEAFGEVLKQRAEQPIDAFMAPRHRHDFESAFVIGQPHRVRVDIVVEAHVGVPSYSGPQFDNFGVRGGGRN